MQTTNIPSSTSTVCANDINITNNDTHHVAAAVSANVSMHSTDSTDSDTADETADPSERTVFDSDSDGPVDSSDDDDDDSEEGRMTDLLKKLAQWKLQNNITNSAFNDLLKILRHEHPRLPKDARTVVPPPKHVQYRQIAGGVYHHFGVVSSVTTALQNDREHVHDGFNIELQLGIDGLPVHKSTRWHLWPILGKVENTPSRHVFAIGLFFGESRPSSCTDYLTEFMDEYTAIRRSGFQLFGCAVTLTITTAICDAQARALVKCIRQHNHKAGCDKCCIKGEWDGKRTIFVGDGSQRTDESFRLRQQINHHQEDGEISPFEKAGLGACCDGHNVVIVLCTRLRFCSPISTLHEFPSLQSRCSLQIN